jgi:cell division protein FtsX
MTWARSLLRQRSKLSLRARRSISKKLAGYLMLKFALSVISLVLIAVVIITGMFLMYQSTKENRNGFQSASKVQAAASRDAATEDQ